MPVVVETLADEDEDSNANRLDTVSLISGDTDPDANDNSRRSSMERAEVKWDEAVAVDAVMLGDAIEAFLKGISEPPVVEKRVSFKKC